MNSDYMYSDYADSLIGAGAGAAAVMGLVGCAVAVVVIISLWKLFSKAGQPGWAAIIPFYNAFVLFKIGLGSGGKMFLMLIPIYNIVVAIQLCIGLAKNFGKGGGFAAGLAFSLCFLSSCWPSARRSTSRKPDQLAKTLLREGLSYFQTAVPGYLTV